MFNSVLSIGGWMFFITFFFGNSFLVFAEIFDDWDIIEEFDDVEHKSWDVENIGDDTDSSILKDSSLYSLAGS